MVVMYSVFGRQVGSHVLAMITLGTVFGGSAYAMRGDKKATQTPPINASTSEEGDFIQNFLKQAEDEDKKKAKH